MEELKEDRMFPKDVAQVHVTDDDDLKTLLDRADEEPLVLERNGVRYVLNREDVGVYYDPEAAREAMRTAGTISPETAARLREELARRRGQTKVPVGS
jgi:hypothetical protein